MLSSLMGAFQALLLVLLGGAVVMWKAATKRADAADAERLSDSRRRTEEAERRADERAAEAEDARRELSRVYDAVMARMGRQQR